MSDTIAPPNPFLGESADLPPLEEVYHPEIHSDTLGKQLVYDANQTASYAVAMDPPLNKAGAHRELLNYQDSLHVDLVEFRTFIRQIPQSQRDEYGIAVYESLPRFQQEAIDEQQKEDHKPPSSVLDWLVERPTRDLRGEGQGPGEEFALRREDYDQRILNFLQSHGEYIKSRQQDPEFLQKVEFEKEMWTMGIQYGVDSGWLHTSALDRAEKLDDIEIYEGDDFSTFLQDRAGYHILGSDDVLVGKDATDAVAHELNHACLDGEDPDRYKNSDEALSKEEYQELRERMEALTEHGALVIRGELLDVEECDAEKGVYNSERQKYVYGPVQRAQNIGVDLKVADFMLFYSAVGEDRDKYEQKITEKIAETKRLEEQYLG